MRKLAVLLASTMALLGTIVGVAVADPGLTPGPAFTPHKHFLVKANGQDAVEVGPEVCSEGTASPNWGAFLQFHANHHTHGGLVPAAQDPDGGPQGPVAPGMHNNGRNLVSGGC
jgi:hypothetical protein